VLHFSVEEWRALPYWHKAIYRKGLADEFAAPQQPTEQQVEGPSEEGLAELERAGITVIRKG
jgi:hypothetical protein